MDKVRWGYVYWVWNPDKYKPTYNFQTLQTLSAATSLMAICRIISISKLDCMSNVNNEFDFGDQMFIGCRVIVSINLPKAVWFLWQFSCLVTICSLNSHFQTGLCHWYTEIFVQFDSSCLNDAYVCQVTKLLLIQKMARGLFGAKPESMVDYC